MDILMRSHSKYRDMAVLRWPHLEITYFTVSTPDGNAPGPVCGHYSVVDGFIVALFCHAGRLYLLHGQRLLTIDENARSRVHRDGPNVNLRISGDSFTLELSQEYVPMIENDFTPFVEVEHFNFLVFLHNVLSDRQRQHRMFGNC